MSKPKSFRACFVPLCTNTTETTPDKVFLNVPLEVKRRNQWFKAVGRDNPKTRTRFSCCEDHFDLKEDINNYLYYKTMGGRVRIKINVVPHKFTCHSNCNPSSNLKPNRRTLSNLKPNCEKQASAIPSLAAEKKRKQQITQGMLNESSENIQISITQECIVKVIVDDDFIVNFVFDEASNKIADEKCNVETQIGIQCCNVAIQTNIRPKYRGVSVICKLVVCAIVCTSRIKLLC